MGGSVPNASFNSGNKQVEEAASQSKSGNNVNQFKGIDNYEIRNTFSSAEEEPMMTDQDAEFKRTILQLIYLDDIVTF